MNTLRNAHDAGEHEEYGALIVGIGAASLITAATLAVFGPGLIILTVVGGVSALLEAKGGREFGERLYE